ncbi:M23 family metallopeptidase [Novosphingobium sp.]|uniref:M23 family metallopeptidase n=1 Tax=Novosphingobium sp. TaxID=1874826 RepID=UPI00261A2456|nr:M23 family metallopeptidase [Novosphingobium sp.]
MLGPRDELGLASTVTFGRARPGVVPARRTPILPPPEPPPPPAPTFRDSNHPLAKRWTQVCHRIEYWAGRHALVPDLAENVGSAGWFRGLGLLVGFTVLALMFWPRFAPLEAAPLTTLDEASQVEFRAQSLRSFAKGSTQGRHFAATEVVTRLAAAPERPEIQLSATIGENDSLPRMLQRAGVGSGDAGQIAAMVASAVPLAEIAPGTRFSITLGARGNASDPRPLMAIGFRPRFDLAISINRQGGGLALSRKPITVDVTPLRVQGLVGTSLYRSARAAGAPPSAVQDYLRAIDQAIPFEEIAPTDTFDLVVAYKHTADGEGEAGNLLYAGVVRTGQPRAQLLRWGADGSFTSLADLAGGGQTDGGLFGAPVSGHVTSGYGMRRHPILGYVRMHAGVDFAASWGSPIYAVTDGRVAYAGWHGGHGNYVRLDHGGGIATGYGHMSRIAVAPGMAVRRGQIIGYVGSTGLSTGAHLHYEVYRGGQTVDPFSVRMVQRTQAVDPRQVAAFKARLQALLSVRPGAIVGTQH